MSKQPIELSESDIKELLRILKTYYKEINKCKNNKLFLAGSIIIGAALECSLILMVNCYPEEVMATREYPIRKGKIKPLKKWNLAELIKVAKVAKWLPHGLKLDDKWSRRNAKIGDYAEVIRYIRNVIHPTCYMDNMFGKRITSKYLETAFNILSAVNDSLYYKLTYDIDKVTQF